MKRRFASGFIAALLISVSALFPLQAGAYALNDENIPLSRQILTEGMVLLKNEADTLPLKQTDRIAVFGSSCVYTGKTTGGFQIGGGGSSELTPNYTPVDPLSALEAADEAGEIVLYKPLAACYRNDPAYVPDDAMYALARAATDKAVMIFSRYSTEGGDRKAEKGDWYLSDEETAMLRKLCSLYDDVIVLVNSGGAIDTSWAVEEVDGIDVQAVLLCFFPGAEGGNAIADLLLGKANPSGRLSMTLAADINDYPSTDGFDNLDYTAYTEDIYSGYRYFTTFNKKVNYDFGFGLSYTTFSFADTECTVNDGTVTVRVKVTNTGDAAGKEVVQVYYGAPRIADGSKLGNPKAELAGFAKTKLLSPDESETVTVSFPVTDMASFDDLGATGSENRSAYVLEKGDYTFYVGSSVNDALANPCGSYHVASTVKTEQLHAYCAPTALNKRLRDDGSYEDLTAYSFKDLSEAPKVTESAVKTDSQSVITGRDVLEGRADVDGFLAQMSDSELVTFMVGHDGSVDNACGAIGGSEAVRKKYILPEIQTADGPGGLRLGRKATGWGCETLVGCTWNTDLAERMAKGIAAEALISYVDVWLAPGVNLHRSPLCGRNFEYYSEDPLLTGKLAAAAVSGAQDAGIYSAVKHFAANEKELNRNVNDSRVSERALRELYLKAFEICVKEASPRFIMSSYNYLNGHETAERYDLLTGILRGEFGFDGVILTDWYNDSDPVKELLAGINVKMPIGDTGRLLTAVSEGRITRAQLIAAVRPTVCSILESGKASEISMHTVYADEVTPIPAEDCYRVDGYVYRNDFLMNIGAYDARGNFVPTLLHYFINVEKAGYYELTLSCLNESGKDHADSIAVLVDGKQSKGIYLDNKYLSTSFAFSDKSCGTLYLPAGEHTFCIKVQNYLGRLDTFCLTPASKPDPDPDMFATLTYSCTDDCIGTLPAPYGGKTGDVVTLSAVILKRSGYTFDGWTDGQTVYAPGSSYTLNGDTELRAVWTAHTVSSYSYFFTGASGYTGSLPQDVTNAGSTLVIPACTAAKNGYTLTGFTDGSRIYRTGDTVTAANEYTVLTAVWTPNGRELSTLIFDGTRPDFDNRGLYFSSSADVLLTADPDDASKYAYHVKAKNGAVYSAFYYRNAAAGYPLCPGHTYDVTLEYFVEGINVGNANVPTDTNPTAVINIEYGGNAHLIKQDSAPIGQWRSLNLSFTVGSGFTPSDDDKLCVYCNPDSAHNAGFNFYIADFSVVDRTKTVTFECGECTGTPPSPVNCKANTDIRLPAADISRGGYVLIGWTDGVNVYRIGDSYTVTDHTTLHAVWSATSKAMLSLVSGNTYSEAMSFSYRPFTTAADPDNASAAVFRTDNGILIFNSNGLLAFKNGHSYRLCVDVRPDTDSSFALFCSKDKSAVPETFVYQSIGNAPANVWTTLSADFTLDGFNNVPDNSLQLQISGASPAFYFKGFTVYDLSETSEVTVSFVSEEPYEGTLPDAMSADLGSGITLPGCTAKREGAAFDGWLIDGVFRDVGSTYKVSGDTVCEAVWLSDKVVFALRPERTYTDVKNFGMTPLAAAKNPDNTTETVFTAPNGIYIDNALGRLPLKRGKTYRLSFDIRPSDAVDLALFCNKDKTAVPESFIYTGIGKAEANTWTSMSVTFTLDSYNDVPSNSLQLQTANGAIAAYFRNIELREVSSTVELLDVNGSVVGTSYYMPGAEVALPAVTSAMIAFGTPDLYEWSDGTNVYRSGDKITVGSEDIRLHVRLKDTIISASDIGEGIKVTAKASLAGIGTLHAVTALYNADGRLVSVKMRSVSGTDVFEESFADDGTTVKVFLFRADDAYSPLGEPLTCTVMKS